MAKNDRGAVGKVGEDLACSYLEDQGFTIAERNWRVRAGELDVVARRGGLMVFVEVKTRRGTSFGEPEEAVTAAKAKRIRGLASEYLLSNSAAEVRFDVVSVMLDPDGELLELRHVPDAF